MKVHIEEAAYAPGATVPRHTHEAPLLAAVLSGSVELTVRRGQYACTRGGVFTHAGEAHANRFGARGARLLLVHFDGALECPSLVADPRVSRLAQQLAGELRSSDTVAPLAREGLGLQLLALAARAEPEQADARWMRRVRDYMEAHLLSPLRLADLAAVAGVHPAHLGRAFRAALGESPAAYLRRRRLEWARERLLASDAPLADIALQAGFCDQGHFARAFRKMTGLTPGQVRREARRTHAAVPRPGRPLRTTR